VRFISFETTLTFALDCGESH